MKRGMFFGGRIEPAQLEARILRRQGDILFTTASVSAGMSVLGTAVVAWTMKADGRHAAIVFVAAAFFILLIRLGLAFMRGRSPRPENVRWLHLATLDIGLSGALWGAMVFWSARWGTDAQVLTSACLGMGAVTMTVMNIAYPPAFQAFSATMLPLSAAGLLGSGRPGHAMIGIAALLFWPMLSIAAGRIGRQIVDSIRLGEEKGQLLDSLAAHAQALEQANADLHRLARIDGLTGLANRRCFEETLEREWRRAALSGGLLALVAIDIDHFKAINDSFGHAAGDEYLRVIAGVLRAVAREKIDTVARPGGEEFAIVLPGADHAEAAALAARLREALRVHCQLPEFPLPRPATVSMGVASISPGQGQPVDQLLREADRALYRAKAEGRDRICLSF